MNGTGRSGKEKAGMRNMWKKMGMVLAASALLMTMPAWAGDGVDLQTVSSNEEEALSLFGDLDGDALSLFEGNTSDGTDALSAVDAVEKDDLEKPQQDDQRHAEKHQVQADP